MGELVVLHELLLTLRGYSVNALLIGGIRRWQWRLSRNRAASTTLHTVRVTGLTAVFPRRDDGIDGLLNRRSMAVDVDVILVEFVRETRRQRNAVGCVRVDRRSRRGCFTILMAGRSGREGPLRNLGGLMMILSGRVPLIRKRWSDWGCSTRTIVEFRVTIKTFALTREQRCPRQSLRRLVRALALGVDVPMVMTTDANECLLARRSSSIHRVYSSRPRSNFDASDWTACEPSLPNRFELDWKPPAGYSQRSMNAMSERRCFR